MMRIPTREPLAFLQSFFLDVIGRTTHDGEWIEFFQPEYYEPEEGPIRVVKSLDEFLAAESLRPVYSIMVKRFDWALDDADAQDEASNVADRFRRRAAVLVGGIPIKYLVGETVYLKPFEDETEMHFPILGYWMTCSRDKGRKTPRR